jgi:uncharacterized membrane protein
MLGNLITVAGFGVLVMALIPNEPTGRLMFLLCGSVVLIVGVLLVYAARTGNGNAKKAVVQNA